jgi:hypothetical protein
MGAATATDTSTADADTIMGGTGAADTTSIAIITIIAAGKAFAPFAFVIPLPGRYANGSDTNGRAVKARPVL